MITILLCVALYGAHDAQAPYSISCTAVSTRDLPSLTRDAVTFAHAIDADAVVWHDKRKLVIEITRPDLDIGSR